MLPHAREKSKVFLPLFARRAFGFSEKYDGAFRRFFDFFGTDAFRFRQNFHDRRAAKTALTSAHTGAAPALNRVKGIYGQRTASLTGTAAILSVEKTKRQSLSRTVVADAFFSKGTFITPMCENDFHVISRFRNDVILYYPTLEQKTGKRGHPKWFDGKIGLCQIGFDSVQGIRGEQRKAIRIEGIC